MSQLAPAARQIPFAFVTEVAAETLHGETIGRVSEEFHDRVRSWFHEESVEDQEGQQVPGTLLLFSHGRICYVCAPWPVIRPSMPAPETAPETPAPEIPGIDDARVPPAPEIAPETWSESNRRMNNILHRKDGVQSARVALEAK